MKFKTLSMITATLLTTTLTQAEETLQPIDVLSINKTKHSIDNTTSNVTVVTSADIEERGYYTVDEALKNIAGITVSRSGGMGQKSSFFLRGADSGKILVLVDGMRLNDPSTTNGTANLESLTTENIERIEIVKGGQSAIWGSNASAGVINIITKGSKNGVGGSITLGGGSYGTKKGALSLHYGVDNFHASLTGSLLDSDSFSALLPRDAENDAYNNKTFGFKSDYTLNEKSKLLFSYQQIKSEAEYDDNFSPKKADDDYSNTEATQKNYRLAYTFHNENYEMTINASKGQYDREYFTTSSFGNGHNVYSADIKEYSWINSLKYDNNKLVFGLEYKDIDGFNQYNTFPENQADFTNKALFVSNSYNLDNSTLLETNLRYDHFNAFKNQTTYKIGLKHQHAFLDGFTTSANYYSSYDAPSAYQLANPLQGFTLKPSYTKGFDVSLAYNDLLTLTYFDNKVEDGLDYLSDPVTYVGGYKNIDGESHFSGIELTSKYAFTEFDTIVTANYTHLFTYEKEDGTDLIRRAKDTLNIAADYYLNTLTYLGVDMTYIGDREDLGSGFPASKVSTGNYTVWNANLSTTLYDQYKVALHAKNLFDKEYSSIYGYASEGRSIYIDLKYTF